MVVALIAYWVGLCNASAFYDHSAQRWLNRDPLGEFGFETLAISAMEESPSDFKVRSEEMSSYQFVNVYAFVMDSPIDLADTDGRNWFSRLFGKNKHRTIHVGFPVGHNAECNLSGAPNGSEINVEIKIAWGGPLYPPKQGKPLPAPPTWTPTY